MLVKILAFTYRNWIFAKRNLFTFFELLFWPVVSLVSMGLMSGFLKLDQNLLNFVLTGAITAGFPRKRSRNNHLYFCLKVGNIVTGRK